MRGWSSLNKVFGGNLAQSADSWASPVTQSVKSPPTMQETWVPSLCGKDSLEEGTTTHSRIGAEGWTVRWLHVWPWGVTDPISLYLHSLECPLGGLEEFVCPEGCGPWGCGEGGSKQGRRRCLRSGGGASSWGILSRERVCHGCTRWRANLHPRTSQHREARAMGAGRHRWTCCKEGPPLSVTAEKTLFGCQEDELMLLGSLQGIQSFSPL